MNRTTGTLRAAAAVAAAAATLLTAAPAQAHVATPPRHGGVDQTALGLQWYDLTNGAVAASGQPEQVTQNRIWAISWIAAARAVRDGGGDSFQDAAFASALHDTLESLAPLDAPQLDSALASSLAAIPDGPAKSAGIGAGQHEAALELAARASDGLATAAQVDIPWTPPAPAPGVWQPTPPAYAPAIRAGIPSAQSFLLSSNSEFRAGPPPALNSPAYLKALAEVHSVGSATSTTRTPAQTDVANFIAQPSIALYEQVVRGALAAAHRPLTWQTQLVAAFNAIEIDQQIAIYDAKFTYVRWRPVTAIRTGTVDPDPSWTSLIVTPAHPEYPSGHAGYAGTAEAVLTALVGPRPVHPIATTSKTAPGVTLTFTSWQAITQDTINGRVWEGVHFRFSDDTGARVGREVAFHDLPRLWQLGLF